jgi:hypothetical protein
MNASSNAKVGKAYLVWKEGETPSDACIHFENEAVPCSKTCYSKKLIKIRRRNARERCPYHEETPRTGPIRLGDYIEITPEKWAAFKAGRGRWPCCGKEWVRPDFAERPYFMISRGLPSGWTEVPGDLEYYARVLADPRLINLQVSVDIVPELGGAVTPSRGRLAWLAQSPKVMFRFKTTDRNVEAFKALAEELGIRRRAVMETPLRERGVPHEYGTTTPLEAAGWRSSEFGRCNSSCGDCRYENGLTLCLATPAALRAVDGRRESLPVPPRHKFGGIPYTVEAWRDEVREAMRGLGGRAQTRQMYAEIERKFPTVSKARPGWKFRVRVELQGMAEPDKTSYPAVWRLHAEEMRAQARLPVVA